MTDGFMILGVRQLDRSPYNPSEDRVYWALEVVNDEEGPYTIHAWVTGSAAQRLSTFAGGRVEHWVGEQVEREAEFYGGDVGTLYALRRFELRVPDAAA